MRRGSLGIIPALTLLAIARLAFHAIFLPAYEGPDEPHHLGRVVASAREPFVIAFRGIPLDGSITRAVELHPCGPRRINCPPFGTAPGAFNLLHPLPAQADRRSLQNPENHQPPLFYLAAGFLLRLLTSADPTGWLATPDGALLWVRVLSLCLLSVAMLFPLRVLLRDRPRFLIALGLLLLLLPGASEALVRCSNDAALFCWSAFLLYALDRRASAAWMCVLLAAGPMIKLTALPVVAVAIVWLWQRGLRRGAVLGALSAVLVFPVQALRGWLWGGTYEFNRTLPGIHETVSQVAVGLARSLYTIVKTVFWLGGWSSFRAPVFLVIAWFLLLIAFLAAARFRSSGSSLWPHAAGAAVAILGCLLFVIGNRRFYGGWGGVGGWYIWGWAPWILLAFDDLAFLPTRARAILLPATAVFVVLANTLYFSRAFSLYS